MFTFTLQIFFTFFMKDLSLILGDRLIMAGGDGVMIIQPQPRVIWLGNYSSRHNFSTSICVEEPKRWRWYTRIHWHVVYVWALRIECTHKQFAVVDVIRPCTGNWNLLERVTCDVRDDEFMIVSCTTLSHLASIHLFMCQYLQKPHYRV